MFDIQNYAGFVAAILIFQLIPGPGTLAILAATARNGIVAGIGAVLGTLLGDFLYMAAAVGGLAATMRAQPLLFLTLQWFGIAYLCWLGGQLLFRPTVVLGVQDAPRQSGWRSFRQALAVSLTNPKVLLFFVAFFPLFLRPDASAWTLAAMMTHVTLLSLAYQLLLVLAGNAVARRLAGQTWLRRWAARCAGIALLGFAAKLALDER